MRQLPVSEFPSNLLIHIKNKFAFKFVWKEQNSISSVGSPSAEEAVEVGCFVARAAVEVKGLDWLRPARYPPPGEDNMADSHTLDSGGTVRVLPRSQDTGPRRRRKRRIQNNFL